MVDFPDINPTELPVQLYAGPINASGEIEQPQALIMNHAKQLAPDRHVFTGKIECRTSGRQGFADPHAARQPRTWPRPLSRG